MGRNLLELTYLLDAIYYSLSQFLFMYCMSRIDDNFSRISIYYVHLAKDIQKFYGPCLIYVHITQTKDIRVLGNITFVHHMYCARRNTIKAVQGVVIWIIVLQTNNGFNDNKWKQNSLPFIVTSDATIF